MVVHSAAEEAPAAAVQAANARKGSQGDHAWMWDDLPHRTRHRGALRCLPGRGIRIPRWWPRDYPRQNR